ncbi:MAG: hypothetical protein UR63_C0027G0009 [Candidatus Roizmanbacteria bacterium GW2011_GWC2_35_12]|uniref:Uncharacterized protein n=1 Tax=Candidatus Roizmanbacteria bacterium GW2011_GWC2_35_12 TaxID=1618485 RepID=A0A0G0DUS1_9BACT|nr:MAG: hypothetical protein UR63_C0027G0009 [Candidatus Roizmanbacteria bacterium GW2011_GWC2_35_12]
MMEKTVVIGKAELFSLERVLPILAFAIPFFISGPQLLTGTVVNCLLFLSTRYTSKKTSIIVAMVPSVGALLNGLVFGKFTPFLVYFIPFIWVGNFILIKTFPVILGTLSEQREPKGTPESKNRFWLRSPPLVGSLTRMTIAIFLSALLKSSFLFIFAFLFLKLQIVPQIFLTAMGVFQFATAIMGGVVFLGINKLLENRG